MVSPAGRLRPLESTAGWTGRSAGRTKAIKCLLQVRRRFTTYRHWKPRSRMSEAQTCCVQPLPFQTQASRQRRVCAIRQVTNARMANGRHVDSDLMRASGFEVDLDQTRVWEGFKRRVVRDARLASGNHRPAIVR